MIPYHIIVMNNFPLNINGKVNINFFTRIVQEVKLLRTPRKD